MTAIIVGRPPKRTSIRHRGFVNGPRAQTERERKAARADADARSWREDVCGGPLVDIARPLIGGRTEATHQEALEFELRYRAQKIDMETRLLAAAFAEGCWLPIADRVEMLADWTLLHNILGSPGPLPTHSTASTTPATTPIPRL